MEYLEAAIILKRLISKTNSLLLKEYTSGIMNKNIMLIRSNFGNEIEVNMKSYTNQVIKTHLEEYANSEAFVISDFVSAMQDGKLCNYFVYKGYGALFDKGLVFYQFINNQNFQPIGKLEFSNLEQNIFYDVDEPKIRASKCCALETDENTAKNPSVAYLIENENEDRLLFDIQKLIYETANKVQKHKKRHFKFYIKINKFIDNTSPGFFLKLDNLQYSLTKEFNNEYPNCTFIFTTEN